MTIQRLMSPKLLKGRLVFSIVFSAFAWLAPTPSYADTPMDYMVQQVCDNGSGGHTSEDPLNCQGRARKLRIGELLPYHKYDGTGGVNQISDSYPIADIFNRFRVVHTFFFTRKSSDPYFDAANYQTGDTGYDMTGADGNYVAGIGTYDPGRGWQPFFTNSSCSMSDAWLLAPKNGSIPLAYGQMTNSLNLSSPQCPPNSSFGTSYTTWNYYNNVGYQNGSRLSSLSNVKYLNTIKVWHFSTGSVNSDAIEIFYYTKEYGKTKWEAWKSTADSRYANPSSDAVERCGLQATNGRTRYGSTDYTLQDCHDWSRVVARTNDDWNPTERFHIDPIYYSQNLLSNTHMQCTNGTGRAADCGTGGGVCQTIAPWGRLGNLNWGYDQRLMGASPTANCALQFSIPSAAAGQSVYQDTTNIPTQYRNLSFGAALWSPNATSQNVIATMVVYQMDQNGAEISRQVIRGAFGAIPTYLKGRLTTSTATKKLRFEVYPETSNVVYEMTDAWIAPEPS